MAGRNRMSYLREPALDGQYPAYAYGSVGSQQQPGPLRDSGMRGRDVSGVRRDWDRDLARRPPYDVVSGRDVGPGFVDGRMPGNGRGMLPLPATEPSMFSNQPILNPGLNRMQDGFLGPGGMDSHLHHPVSMRTMDGVGVHNYGNAEGYGSLQQQQVQLSDGSMRSIYSVPELHGEVGMKVPGGFHGDYGAFDDGKLGLAAASQSQKQYQGRQMGRDGRLMNVGGWEDEGPPMSPRAFPMSPRRDDVVSMMSPRRGELSPPLSPRRDRNPHMMSPRRDDIPLMMSPRRDDFPGMINPSRHDISPSQSPTRRSYQAILDYEGRMQHRKGASPSRERDFLFHAAPDYNVNPRRGLPLNPPLSPSRDGWDYETSLRSSPHMQGRLNPLWGSPPRSPVWGRPRHSNKAPSQWDVPPGRSVAWNFERDRPSRREHHRYRGPEHMDYRVDLDEQPRRPGWSMPRRKEGRDGRHKREDGHDEPHGRSSGRGLGDHQFGMPSGGKLGTYNSVVNQRVGLITKYIERERAEKAAERAAKEAANKGAIETSRKGPAEESKPSNDISKPRAARRNEKDTLAAAIARSTGIYAKHGPNASKRTTKSEKTEKSNPGPGDAHFTGNAGPSDGNPNGPDTATDVERVDVSKVHPADSAGPSAPCNRTVVAGSSEQITSAPQISKDVKQADKENRNPESHKIETEALLEEAAGNKGEKTEHMDNGTLNTPAIANGDANSGLRPGGVPQSAPGVKRTSLVVEIERAKKNRKLAEHQNHVNSREVEETYYDANELSAEFVVKMNRSGSRFSRMINDDVSLKKTYEGGGQGGLYCLVCGKGSKMYSNVHELVTHAQQSPVQSMRIDHMGFRKALLDLLKLDIKNPSLNKSDATEEMIAWPPVVVVENTRTVLGADRRWEGVTNSEMTLFLNELGHLHGRAKSVWDRYGHRGIVNVEFDPTLEGLQEAERLHNYFLQNGRGRVQWDIIRPCKTGLPGLESIPEGPDFCRFDEETQSSRRVLYGYLALNKDVDKIFSKKQRKKVQVVSRKEMKTKLLAWASGEKLVI